MILLGDPTQAPSARWPSPSAGGSSPRSTWPRSSAFPLEWFALSAGAQDRDGQRHREHGLDRRRPAADRAVHPGRRRDQRRRHRHQRRRPALLERRGDDAHAHARHPGHDARERHGADRQAGARLLRRRLGRGQLRHRRLRAHHGPQRPGPVLGARPRGRLPHAARLLRARLRRARRALPAPRRDVDPPERDVRLRRAPRARLRPLRASATSSPTRPTPSARSRSTSAR